MAKAILPAKLLLRNVYRLLASKITWNDMLLIDQDTKTDLEWWYAALRSWNGAKIHTGPINFQVETDASMTGWGARVRGTNQMAAGFWNDRVSRMPSNYREMMAVVMALKSFHFPPGKRIQVLTDNITTAAYINHLGGPSRDLSNLAQSLWMDSHERGLIITATYLRGVLNTTADQLSRLSSHYEWQLHRGLFNYIDRLWGPHTIDRFATVMNTHLPTYNSRYADPNTSGVDALAQQDWAMHNNFVNPPFRLIPKILQVIETQGAHATLIAPWWEAQTWFQKLKQLSVRPPLKLPKTGLTHESGLIPEACKNKKWRIYAWRLCGHKKLTNNSGLQEHLCIKCHIA
jgi:hypothetical protein